MSTHRHIRQHWSVSNVAYRVADASAIFGGLWFTASFARGAYAIQTWILVGTIAIGTYWLIAEFSGMYRNWRGVSAERELVCSFATWGMTLLILLAPAWVAGFVVDTRATQVLFWFAATPSLMMLLRSLLRAVKHTLRARGFNRRGFAIVGINDLGIQLAQNMQKSPELGLELSGFFDDRPAERLPEVPSVLGEHVGNIGELIELAEQGKVSMVYVTFPMRAEDRIRHVLEELGNTTASVYIVPDFFVFQLLHSRWTDINGLPVVSVFENPFYGVDGILKRLSDVLLASLAFLLCAIPMLIIGLLIKITSPGPVFFRQHRYGLDGREILVWKFRSMRVCENGNTIVQAQTKDPRVTGLGAILRRTSLDELPQLFNVMTGSMSLVGPRPHASAHNELYRGLIQGYMLRHKVKPGITGLAQVRGWRGETDTLEKMERRIECDHQYIREWSLWMDIKILFQTIFVVFSRKNAY